MGTIEMLSWILAYCVASSSMTILNKAAIGAFNYPFWLCTLQNLATLLVLGLIVAVAPKGHKIFGLRVKYSNKVVLTWTPAAILFCTMLVSAMSAMQTMSVTTVLVTRSLTPLVTLILESRVLGVVASPRIWISLISILGGSVFYCMAEIEGTLVGYVWLGINLIAAAAYHVYVKKVINDLNLSTMDMVVQQRDVHSTACCDWHCCRRHASLGARLRVHGWAGVAMGIALAPLRGLHLVYRLRDAGDDLRDLIDRGQPHQQGQQLHLRAHDLPGQNQPPDDCGHVDHDGRNHLVQR